MTTIPIARIPDNSNFLQTTKYTFIIPELPFARYFCQSVNLPGVNTTEVAINTPFATTYRHGDKLAYDSLTMSVLVDEDFRVWEETYKWLISLTKPTKFPEYVRNRPNKLPYYDGVLTMNTNANLPNLRIKYTDCHPVSIGGIQFSAADSADTTPVFDITFRYDVFFIERF